MNVNMNSYQAELENIFGNDLSNSVCPSTCQKSNLESGSESGSGSGILEESDYRKNTYSNKYYFNNRILDKDKQLNVWKYGDIPEDSWKNTSSGIEVDSEFPSLSIPFLINDNLNNYDNFLSGITNPKKRFGTTSPYMTYYKCESTDTNNPFKLTQNYSSIPCSYKQNYIEKGRYICKKDPNNYTTGNISDICNDVSINT
jgi:hypothetical protein